MKRMLVLPLVAAALASQARSQPGDDFDSVLRTTPSQTAPARQATPTPGGLQPLHQAEDAPPPNPFPLPADAPQWMICAAAFSGPDGAELARQVCVELRQKGYSAYVFNRGDEERKRQEEEWQRLKAASFGAPVRKRMVRIVDNYAVLIAGWPDFRSASEKLSSIKELPMPVLRLPNGRPAYDVQAFQDRDGSGRPVTRHGRVNPYHSAMVTRNPLATHQTASKPKFDPFWKRLNENEEYSLLASRGKFTLLVKEYSGARTMEEPTKAQGLLETLGLKGKANDTLDAAGAQAHELAKFLRDPKLGFKAFVLHTRNSSVVTVGEFSGPDDPDMQRVLRQLAALKFGSERGGGGADPIALMPSPLPVEVPRP